MDLGNLVLLFLLIATSLFFYKYFSLITNKYKPKLLIDDELKKPQAFHESPTLVTGGTGIFFSFLIVYFYFVLFKDLIFLNICHFVQYFLFLGSQMI